jgi:hypothetical protein
VNAIYNFFEVVKPHGYMIALVLTWICIGIVALRRRLHWRRKQFLTLVNFSLNYTVGSQLAMRTLLESTTDDVWPNEYGVKKLLYGAARATIENPFIVMDEQKDRDFVNRAVLNMLSQRFAETFIAASLGVPVRSATFIYAVTCEKYTDIRTLKVRVLLIEERTLERLFGKEHEADRLQITNPIYKARLRTLRGMYDLYAKDLTAASPVLGRVELGVVTPGLECAVGVPTCGTSTAIHA